MNLPEFKMPKNKQEKDLLRILAMTFRHNAKQQCRVKRSLIDEDILLLMMFEKDLLEEFPWPDLAQAVKNGWIVKTQAKNPENGEHRNVYAYTGRHCLPRSKWKRFVRHIKSMLGYNVDGPALNNIT